jgi:hypothetical protein
MGALILKSDAQLRTRDCLESEVNFDRLSPSAQVWVFRAMVSHIASSIPTFVRLLLSDRHERYDKGLRIFEGVTVLGPDVTWADRVCCLIPLKCGNHIGDRDQSLNRWIEHGIFLRSDGQLLEVSRTSEVQGVLICNTTPLEVTVSVMTDDRLIKLVACRGELKTLFRRVIGAYRAYVADEFGRLERAQKLQEFCDQFRFLVSKALLKEE